MIISTNIMQMYFMQALRKAHIYAGKKVCIVIMLYICYVQLLVKIGKHHLTFSKRLGHHLISLKKFI